LEKVLLPFCTCLHSSTLSLFYQQLGICSLPR
jgi:hypothetical protein